MNKVKKITNLVIDKQPNLDINQLINCLNDCQERIDKAIEYCRCHFKQMVADEEAQKLLEILKGE